MISSYFTHLAIMIGIYSILTMSLNLSVGYTGLLNLGHLAFFGIGAYATALLSLHVPVWTSIVIAALIASIAGCALGFPTTRLKGDYLALATLGFTFIAGSIARNWISLTRGALGIPGITKLATNQQFLIIVLVLTAVVYFLLKMLTASILGKRCQAVRDDELAAETIGINAFTHKLLSLTISSALAGLAGALYAHYLTFIDPSVFGLADIVLILSMLIVGGMASLEGSLIGTALIVLLPEPLRFLGLPSSILGPAEAMLFAIFLILIILYKPKGILGKVDL